MFCFQERSVPVSLPGTRAETVVEAARSVAVEAVSHGAGRQSFGGRGDRLWPVQRATHSQGQEYYTTCIKHIHNFNTVRGSQVLHSAVWDVGCWGIVRGRANSICGKRHPRVHTGLLRRVQQRVDVHARRRFQTGGPEDHQRMGACAVALLGQKGLGAQGQRQDPGPAQLEREWVHS